MLIETISGKCPCCNYNKLLQRYGTASLDGCPKCGFGYSDHYNHYYNDVGPNLWLGYGLYIISMITGENIKNLQFLTYYQQREKIFKTVEKLERNNDLENTVFDFSLEEIERYKKSKPLILSSKLLLEFI